MWLYRVLICFVFFAQNSYASGMKVKAFESSNYLFIEIPDLNPDPNFPARWLIVDIEDAKCIPVHGAWARKVQTDNFTQIYDFTKGLTYNLQKNGELFVLKDGETNWETLERGSWLNDLTWSTTERYLVWMGENRVFLNDPRPVGEQTWFQIGPNYSCQIFNAASRTFEFPSIQTVVLESGIPNIDSWTITSGYSKIKALEEIGNWLY